MSSESLIENCMGHEIVGAVKEVGSNVKCFEVGDRVGVGPYVNSCQDCNFASIAGVYVIVEVPKEVKFKTVNLIMEMRTIAGSIVGGGTQETKEMVEFCAENGIYPEIEIIPIQYVNGALERLENRDVKYRFVIDIGQHLELKPRVGPWSCMDKIPSRF
ncbi:hypothetical protein CISIN_1g040822mg [Citrus sinensis]|uniref:cinnamyl-alcohol dehydrogenase n=1 Tax=Citrus sinensis TaxID=2711 RepID=A0A067GVB9_CITSI|nr:hypothetical protein CISIN_1g040822mg [Citrus sinensis]